MSRFKLGLRVERTDMIALGVIVRWRYSEKAALLIGPLAIVLTIEF